jgi:hypothetical protein
MKPLAAVIRPLEWVVATLVGLTLDTVFGKPGPAYRSETSCDCGGLGIIRSGLGGGWRACGCPAADKLYRGSD